MKHVTTLFALLLAFGLLTACGKDEPDLIGDYPYEEFTSVHENPLTFSKVTF